MEKGEDEEGKGEEKEGVREEEWKADGHIPLKG